MATTSRKTQNSSSPSTTSKRTTAKPRGSTSRGGGASRGATAASRGGGATRGATARRTQARKTTNRQSAASRSNGQSAASRSNGESAASRSKSANGRGTLVKAALGAVAGTAAVGAAGAAALRRNRRPQVLGVSLPKEFAPHNVNPAKLAKKVDLNKLAKQVGSAAEQIEARSDDVRMISGQVKRLTKRIS